MICSLEETLAVFTTTISSSFGVLPNDWQPLGGFRSMSAETFYPKAVKLPCNSRGRNFSSEIR